MLILDRWLAEVGHPVVFGSPAHLTRGWRRPRVLGEGVDAAFRFYPGEWMPGLPNFGEWLRVGARLPMMNPLLRMIRQSKSVFSLWDDDSVLPGVELLRRNGIERVVYASAGEFDTPESAPPSSVRIPTVRRGWLRDRGTRAFVGK